MKEHESEWISVSDFMASLIGVLVIFLIAAVIEESGVGNSVEEIERRKEEKAIEVMLRGIAQETKNERNPNSIFKIYPERRTLEMDTAHFASGSPCLAKEAEIQLRRHAAKISELLVTYNRAIVTIEGYADTTRVPQSTFFPCGKNSYQYGDNVTLSLHRAQEARSILISEWNNVKLSERVAILGYGATKPAPGAKSLNANRRVLVRFVPGTKART
ncbi:OmpA family protein [Dyadobacter chenwenxiniae]|uniref:OmpA family protein n=1 Tax=Dyadobacter chenwenxiniae TaxID=2906456 RepID=A0A9X1PIC8_9BACT|nr:OmpA family protein [Dyadobacter chenwenxiniae]MCF0061358.1 OmpA family protein [Dyadobacter chenwenxiniae]UON81180.1 OmpA family protein [Dyadobacter chenwenxiniae]